MFDDADRHNRVLQMFKKPQRGHGYALSEKIKAREIKKRKGGEKGEK